MEDNQSCPQNLWLQVAGVEQDEGCVYRVHMSQAFISADLLDKVCCIEM
jgi:hypothetical protein